MAEGKLHYNERFSFSDPSCRLASSRSTRCRYKRLRQHQELIIDDEDRDLQLLEGQNQANPHNPTVNIIRKETTLTPLKSHCCDGELDDETMPQAEDIDTIDHSYEDVSELLAYRDSPNDNDDEETEESSSEQELFMSQLAMDELSNPEGEEEESNTSMPGEGSHQSRRGTLIYDGSSLTAEGSLALLMQYKVRHNITYKALGDLLKLLKLHCPIPNYIPATVYQFKKHFSQLGYSTVMHLYCSYCLGNVDTPELKNCINPHCKADLSSSGSISSFIEVPLDAQLKTFFKRESFVNALQKRFSERKGSSSKYSDIYDGEVYQGMYNNGFLQEVNNISLILNCDGIPVFRSSGYSFWPQFLLINELPYKMRLSKEYRLFAGIWYGCSKPDMNLFLKPLMDSLKNLYTSGVTVTVVTSDGDIRTVVCRAALICGTFDLPARAAVLNMVQFNGYWGCSKCLQKGTRVKTTSSGHGSTHVYPYKDTNPYGPVRTHKQFITDSQNAFKKGSNEYGIKGPTALALLPSFNLVKGIAVDYMHCILLGVCRLLLRLWLNTEHHQSLWYIGGKTEEMDELLFKIKPPDEIKRVPRSFQTVKYWKAHELRAWLLHYSPVVLHDFLHEIYYQHHLLLVESTFLLLQDTVSETDIEQSERLLQHYCFLFGNIYGERYMTMNVHNLLHLPSVVRQLGPLWVNSCFGFETAIGELLSLFHGSQGIEDQVVLHVSALQKLPEVAQSSLPAETTELSLYFQMTSRTPNKKFSRQSRDYEVMGYPHNCILSTTEKELFASSNICLHHKDFQTYPLIHLSNRIIAAKSRSKAIRRNNSCIQYLNGENHMYGIVEKIFVCENSCFILIQDLAKQNHLQLCSDDVTDAKIDEHIIACNLRSCNYLIAAEQVSEKCVLVDVGLSNGIVYVSHLPNSKETE